MRRGKSTGVARITVSQVVAKNSIEGVEIPPRRSHDENAFGIHMVLVPPVLTTWLEFRVG